MIPGQKKTNDICVKCVCMCVCVLCLFVGGWVDREWVGGWVGGWVVGWEGGRVYGVSVCVCNCECMSVSACLSV